MVATQTNNLRAAPTTTVAELQDTLADRARGHHDITVRAGQLRYDADIGAIEVQGHREYGLRTLALNQIAAKLGVPAQYLRKCPWDLRAENINHWLNENRTRSFMLRCDGDEVRAVLSDRYAPVDHLPLAGWLADSFGPDARLRYEVSEEVLHVQFVNGEGHNAGVNDWLHPGVGITNSEVGLARVQVRGLLFRTICLNGLILSGGEENWTRRHIGSVELAGDVQKAIRRVQDAAANGTNRFAGLQGIRVPDMTALFERITKHYELTQAEHETVLAAHQIEPGDTLYAGVNAVTRAGNAYDLPLDSRLKLQDIGGRILTAAEVGARWLN
ncbi:MAG: DUF932 domain-containing protein [Planctomycetes bacterium]|nr:DUF932 domain-containing protein [Planctomycetota bacterium]